jgi:hypothetical protein
MKKQYKKFVFGETLQKAINHLPESEQLRFYRIIVAYGIDGIEPDLKGFEAAVWVQMKDMIDNTRPHAGAPSGNQNAKKQEDDENNPETTETTENNPETIKTIKTIKTIENNPETIKTIKTIETIENNPETIKQPFKNININTNTNINKKEKENNKDCFSFSDFSKPEFQSEHDPPDPHPPDPNISAPHSFPRGPPSDQKAESKEDATSVFQKARSLWNDLKIPPECRDLIIPPSEYECLRTFQNYSWADIENAIQNYDWHFNNWNESG